MKRKLTAVKCSALISWMKMGALLFVGLLFSGAARSQITYFVKTSGNDANTGSSWMQAFKTLQKALATATSGDQIWVAQGTYYPDEGEGQTNDDRSSTFSMKEGVSLYGGFAGTESLLSQRNWQMHETILNGDLMQNDGADFAGYDDNAYHVVSAVGINKAIVDGFTIRDGNARLGVNAEDIQGGGMHCFESSPFIFNCSFLKNAGIYGGGMYNYYAAPVLTNCRFLNNWGGNGGGFYNENSNVTLANSDVSGNESYGLFDYYSNSTLTNCRFWKNTGGIYGFQAGGDYVNCIIAGNQIGLNSVYSAPRLVNCILWGNNQEITGFLYRGSIPRVSYSIVQGGYSGNEYQSVGPYILDLDPLFVEAASGNLRLQACSPAINAGDNSANSTTTDLDGNPRKVGTIDMGAYEYQGEIPSVYTYYRDQDGDGFGDLKNKKTGCAATAPPGYVSNNLDCNDYRVFYQDNDHDGWGSSVKVPCGNITRTGDCDDNNNRVHSLQTFYRDADGDSWGNPAVSTQVCSSVPPAGYVKNSMDCNDNDAHIRYCPPVVTPTITRMGRAELELQSAALVLSVTPNPFAQTTRIQYTVPVEARVNIKVYDALGRDVGLIVSGQRSAGTYIQDYNASKLASGVYYLRMVATVNDKIFAAQAQKLVRME
jgi:hypothetical protein